MASYSPRKSIIFEFQRCQWHRWNDFRGAIDTAETDFGDFRSDYLGEYDAICKTVLACQSETYMGLIDEKNRGSKISCYCPFKTTTKFIKLTAGEGLHFFQENILDWHRFISKFEKRSVFTITRQELDK
jgi:hypothetical protein